MTDQQDALRICRNDLRNDLIDALPDCQRIVIAWLIPAPRRIDRQDSRGGIQRLDLRWSGPSTVC
jgi:hypothetical protein